MTHFGRQALTLRFACANITYAFRLGLLKRLYSATNRNESATRKLPHPYRNIHPWKSQAEFTSYLLSNLIYNKDGVVVLNKPYGISARPDLDKVKNYRTLPHVIVNPVNYTIEDTLAAIAKELGYKELTIGKCPERYSSGVTILFGYDGLKELMEKSVKRAMASRHLYRTFWALTTMLPKETDGKKTLGLKLKQYADGNKKAIIVDKWSRNEVQDNTTKLLRVEFKVIAKSKYHLSSLLEVKTSTTKWHAVRLFAATELLSPVLGDNYYGSSIRNIMGTWFPVKRYIDGTQLPPELNNDLLKILLISKSQQELIPVHMHLRSISLPSFLRKGQDFYVEAPLLDPFDWTYKQLFSEPNSNVVEQTPVQRQPQKRLREN